MLKNKPIKDRAVKDRAVKDRAVKDRAVKDRVSKDRATKDKAAKDKAVKDRAVKDRATKDKAIKDRAAKDKVAKDRVSKIRALKVRILEAGISKVKAPCLLFLIGTILYIFCSCSEVENVSITMSGSTAMEKLADVIAESYRVKYPQVTITVEYTGSSAGIEAVLAQRADIGNSSRRLSPQEKAQGAEETVAAIDAIAVITNRSDVSSTFGFNKASDHIDTSDRIKALTTEQLCGIYTGKIRNWREVGGGDEMIVVVGREAGSGTRDAFEELLGLRDQCAYANELDSTGAVLARVASTPGAVGYVSRDVLSDVGDTVQVLALDGCMPTDDNIEDGSYCLTRPFVMVTKGAVPEQRKEVQQLFAYLRSEEGQNLIRSVGLVTPSD